MNKYNYKDHWYFQVGGIMSVWYNKVSDQLFLIRHDYGYNSQVVELNDLVYPIRVVDLIEHPNFEFIGGFR